MQQCSIAASNHHAGYLLLTCSLWSRRITTIGRVASVVVTFAQDDLRLFIVLRSFTMSKARIPGKAKECGQAR